MGGAGIQSSAEVSGLGACFYVEMENPGRRADVRVKIMNLCFGGFEIPRTLGYT